MPHSDKSCAVAFPRVLKNATDNDPATGNATESGKTASKPASIKELREQLRAQQERNQGATREDQKGGELRGELREVLDWLHRIDETDPEIIECTLSKCRMDVDALDYFLGRARE